MAFLAPGVAFIARGLLSLVLPCTLIAGVRLFLAVRFELVVPIWATIVLSILGLPVVLIARYQLLQFRHRRRAAALGARMAPALEGKWPGNLDILLDAMDKLTKSYPGEFGILSISSTHLTLTCSGDGHWQWIEKYGYSFNLNFLWEDEMLTYEPEIIKVSRSSLSHLLHLTSFSRKSWPPTSPSMSRAKGSGMRWHPCLGLASSTPTVS